MAYFPPNARNGQTHKKFGRRFAYSEATESWTPVSTLASVAEVRVAEQAAEANNTTVYVTAVELPLSGNTAGAMAFVQETNRLYLWSGTGWYNVATVASAGASISGASSSYTLSTDGTPTVVTLTQSGLTSPTWSYEVTSGSLGRTATVTQADNVFTITPSTLAKNVGSFGLTFKATDGSNTIVTSSQFTMSNTAPVIGTGPSAAYTLASDGTPTVITLAATDADGHAITWSYEVIGGSLGGTDVSINGSEFTITPSIDNNDAGTFQLRFVASDGASFDANVAEFTLSFDPDWTNTVLLHTLNNPSFGPDDYNYDLFGQSVAISGNYAVVGSPLENTSGTTDAAGAAYIFNVTTGALLHTLAHPDLSINNTSGSGNFGRAVDMKGDYAVITAPASSRAYVYNVTTGALLYAITAYSGHYFSDVAISDSHIIMGTENNYAYIYNLSDGSLLHILSNPNVNTANSSDSFGQSVAIDGNYAVVGAPYEEGSYAGDKTNAGQAYVFDVTTGAKLYNLQPLNDSNTVQAGALFGQSVALSGDYCIVTAPGWDDVGGNNNGRAFVFSVSTGVRLYTLVAPQYRVQFGSDASFIDGSYAVITAWLHNFAYIYDLSDGSLIKTIDNPNSYGVSDDKFGISVAISGNKMIVGASMEKSAEGRPGIAYIFQAG
jgi:hypothetical protein